MSVTKAHSPSNQFHKSTLPGGLRVVTESIPSVRSVSVGVWVFTGSRDESNQLAGMSHFIEHMVFKGTKRRKMHQIARRLEAVGGYLNAFTGKEYTCYFARVLDDHLERAVDVLGDLVLNPTFPKKELEKEKDVVVEEIKMYEDVPEDLIFDRFESQVYKHHTLARPVIGFPDTVRSFDRGQLLSYMDDHYTTNRTVVAIAGNVQHEKAVKYVERIFNGTQRLNGQRKTIENRPYEVGAWVEERPIQQAHLVMGTRTFGIHDNARIALTVLNTILGGGMSSRLNQNIRERYGYCYNIYSFVNLHSDMGDFGVYMGTDPAKVERAKKLIQRELDRLVQKPVSNQLLAQAKNQVKGSIMLGLESMSNRMMRLGRQELYFQKYHSLDEVNASIDEVTATDVREVAEKLFDPANFSHIVFTPTN